jgi:hypothetical protein
MYFKNIILFGFYQILINKNNAKSNLTNLKFSHRLKIVLNKEVKGQNEISQKKERKDSKSSRKN